MKHLPGEERKRESVIRRHGLTRCDHCTRLLDRDSNAVRNMLLTAKCALLQADRPVQLTPRFSEPSDPKRVDVMVRVCEEAKAGATAAAARFRPPPP